MRYLTRLNHTPGRVPAGRGNSLPKSVDETADKLDAMMDIAFAYVGRCVLRFLPSNQQGFKFAAICAYAVA